MTESVSSCPLMDLNHDSLIRISNNLDVRTTNILSQTCKTWRDLIRDNHLLLRAMEREKLLSLSSLRKLHLRDFDSLDFENNHNDKEYFQLISSLFSRALVNEKHLDVNQWRLAEKEKKYVTYTEVFNEEELESAVHFYSNLEGMRLIGVPLRDGDPSLLSQLKNLKFINLFHCNFTNAHLVDLFSLCQNLSQLEIYKNDQITGDGFSLLSEDLENLRCLVLKKCKNITNENMFRLLTRCSFLEYFEIEDNSNITAKKFLELPKFLSLKNLKLINCSNILEIEFVRFLQRCPNLQYLVVKNNDKISGKEFEKVSSLQLSNIRAFSFSGCKFLENEKFLNLCRRCLKLETVDVSENDQITLEGLDQIREDLKIKRFAFEYCKNLMEINLLKLLLRCIDFDELVLEGCELITGDFVKRLPAVLRTKRLVLNSNGNFTNENILELLQRCPNLEILTIGMMDQFTLKRMERFLPKHFYCLKRLCIYQCKNLSNRGIVEILKRCPNLEKSLSNRLSIDCS